MEIGVDLITCNDFSLYVICIVHDYDYNSLLVIDHYAFAYMYIELSTITYMYHTSHRCAM